MDTIRGSPRYASLFLAGELALLPFACPNDTILFSVSHAVLLERCRNETKGLRQHDGGLEEHPRHRRPHPSTRNRTFGCSNARRPRRRRQRTHYEHSPAHRKVPHASWTERSYLCGNQPKVLVFPQSEGDHFAPFRHRPRHFRQGRVVLSRLSRRQRRSLLRRRRVDNGNATVSILETTALVTRAQYMYNFSVAATSNAHIQFTTVEPIK
jgi:hypothetical protein